MGRLPSDVLQSSFGECIAKVFGQRSVRFHCAQDDAWLPKVEKVYARCHMTNLRASTCPPQKTLFCSAPNLIMTSDIDYCTAIAECGNGPSVFYPSKVMPALSWHALCCNSANLDDAQLYLYLDLYENGYRMSHKS